MTVRLGGLPRFVTNVMSVSLEMFGPMGTLVRYGG